MNTHNKLGALASLLVLGLSTAPSSALVIMISDLVPGSGGNIETFLSTNFTNVTEIRHSNWANFNAAGTQDALNGTGTFAGGGAADVVIIGRSLSSGHYDNFDASGYNSLTIPVVSLTSYTVRQNGNRMGWHGSSTTTGQQIGGDESLVTAAGAPILGLGAGTHDLLSAVAAAADNFNGLGAGSTAFGGATILATVGPDTLAAYWAIGTAPGNPGAATVDTFPGPRLLFNTDNDPNSGNNGANDLANMTAAGTQALINAIAFATPLAVSEPGPATPPTVANSAATNVGAASATIGGQVTDTGGEDPTVLIYWGDNNGGTSPGTWDNSIALGTHNGSFSSNLTGLNPSTTYFFRCFATNSEGDSWASSTLSFTT
ncbi:MAG: fibronectin type III domain-containing protein, partial [Roseibacillus sp.]